MEHGDNPERARGEMAGGGPPSSTASDAARVASTTSIPPPHSQAAPSSPEPSSRAVVKWIALSQLLNTAGYMAGSVPRRELLTAAGVGDERSLSYLSAAGSIAAALEFLVCPAIGKLMDAHGRWGVTAAIATLCLAPRLLISTLLATGGEGERGTAKSCCCTRGCKSSWCCNRKVGDDEQSASDATADRQGGWPGQQRPFANVHGGCSFRHCNNPSRIGVDPKQDRMALCPWVSAGSISWYECIDSFECYQTITTLTCRHIIIEG